MMLNKIRNTTPLLLLILAGETIFFLPFIIARVFRPTLLDVFDITNWQLGIWFSFYGVVALFSYFFGGPLADRYPARKLMALALFITGLGGFYMATVPPDISMTYLYAFWGASTILLFWAAMIKATRIWGGAQAQGKAFGFLEGGRGLVAAGAASLLVWAFSSFQKSGFGMTGAEQKEALQYVIFLVALGTLVCSVLVWFFLKNKKDQDAALLNKIKPKYILDTLALPQVWIIAFIVICSYCGYKVTDDFSLLAKDVMGFDDVASAHIGTLSLWMRVVTAILAGILADRFVSSRMIQISFIFVTVGAICVGVLPYFFPATTTLFFIGVMITNLIFTSTGVFALRGLYFALLEEGSIPLKLSGTAVGLISVIGYTPDIFMGPLMGYFLDKFPGIHGHQYIFLILSGLSGIGFLAASIFRRMVR